MPAPGEQHNTALANPFAEVQPRVSEYTAQEIATLQSRLEKQLGPEYLSSRAGPSGTKVHYIAAEKCIALANEVFGFNGWSSAIKEIQVDFVDENPQTFKISLGLSVIVRVTLRDGTFHEDIGYGHIENCTGKAKAFEKAKKEGTTDALKRALRSFGNVLGNCIYDKDYVKKVTKMKAEPSRRWDETGLHRHADFVKREVVVKSEPIANGGSTAAQSVVDSFDDLLGEFDEADFNIVDEEHPDEVSVPQNEKPQPQVSNRPNPQGMQPPSRPLSRSHSAGNPARPPQTPGQSFPRPGPQNTNNQPRPQHPLQQQVTKSRPQGGPSGPASNSNSNANASASASRPHQTPPQGAGQHPAGQNGAASAEGVGFFSARAVKQFVGPKEDEEPELPTAPLGAQAFNPRAESPSIRKTAGIDHTKSKPVARNGQHAPAGTPQAFNPHTESPSIRKTPGIDHTKSAPVGRNGQHVAPSQSGDDDAGTKNPGSATTMAAGAGRGGPGGANVGGGFGAAPRQPQQGPIPAQRGAAANPQLSQARRIGAPVGPGSPMANRGQYRPPTMKRPLPEGNNGNGGARPALVEVSANGPVSAAPGGGGAVGGDPKRQKIG